MFEVIITTYNRANKAFKLAEYIISFCENQVKRVIIVDSTENARNINLTQYKIFHIFSSHQNQPYQRFLGYKVSSEAFLAFLDDDMEIRDLDIFKESLEEFKSKNIIAIAYNFNEKHSDTSLAKVPETILFNNKSHIKLLFAFFTGYPRPKKGKYGLCGSRGPQPEKDGISELISGGAFAVRRGTIYRNFNFQLFDLYENKLGKGEDGILGYTLLKQGRLLYKSQINFLHDDQQDSVYSNNLFSLSKRVAFSRLYLSMEKLRLDNIKIIWGWLHYHYYMLWRIAGLALNFILKPDQQREEVLKGSLKGWMMTFGFALDKRFKRAQYWQNEACLEALDFLSKLQKR